MVVADVSEIDIKRNTNYRSKIIWGVGFSLVGYSTTKIWNLCHVWDDSIVNDMKSLHTMGRTTELRNNVQFALAKDSWWVCIKVCASSRQGCCVVGDQYHFLLEILPQHKLRTTSLIIPNVKLQWLFFLAGWMTFNQQSEQQGLSLLLLQAENSSISFYF